MKKGIVAAPAAAALLTAAGFANAAGQVDSSNVRKDLSVAASGKKYKIATVVKVDGVAWFERMREGVKQFGDETGQDTWLVSQDHSDAASSIMPTIIRGNPNVAIIMIGEKASDLIRSNQ